MQVDLIGHSAGGWLGRAFIGDPDFFPAGSLQHAEASASASKASVGGAQRVSAALPSLPPLMLPLPQPVEKPQQVNKRGAASSTALACSVPVFCPGLVSVFCARVPPSAAQPACST